MLTATNISYRIGKKEILAQCSLSIVPREFTAVVGPNGAGKSSLLKILSNESSRFEGSIFLNGKDTRRISHREMSRQRAVLPQQTVVNFPFTIEEIIEIGRFSHSTTKEENSKIVDAVLTQTNLTALRGRDYQTLSGGEQQRVQLARVLAQTWDINVYPKYLLLDEPTASLDIAQQHNIMQLARRAVERNMGVLAIVHDLNLAAQYADHLIFMKSGKIVAQGKTHTVMTREIIEETFSYPVQLLSSSGRTVVCPGPCPLPFANEILTGINYGKIHTK